MGVIKTGDISLQVKGVFRSQKVMKYGVLYGKTPESHPYLELYDSKDDFDNFKQKGKKCDTKKIDLRHIKTITNQTQTTSKGKEYHMEIRTKKEKNNFLFDYEEESVDWSRYLNALVDSSDRNEETSTSSITGHSDNDGDECVTINEMYGGAREVNRFEVNVDPSDLAKLCNIDGKRNLLVSSTTIAFENISTRQIDYDFQLAWLRRFGKKENVFSFEVGRQCMNGAGNIKCRTEAANYIHGLVSKNSNSRGTTVTPAAKAGIEEAQKKVKTVMEKKVTEQVKPEDNRISGPALHIQKRHPGLGVGPALIPLNAQNSEVDEGNLMSERDSHSRSSAKSVDGNIAGGKASGSIRHGPVSEDFANQLDIMIDPHAKDSIKMKDKDRDSKKKESDRKKEDKEIKKREEKKEKERKEKEKKQKEKMKKDEKKVKEKPQQALPPKRAGNAPGGFYEEVDIIDRPPSPKHESKAKPNNSHYSEPNIKDEVDDPTSETTEASAAEYSTPIKMKSQHVPVEYTDVKIVKGNAWKSHGRAEDEEEHTEDYSEIKSVRQQIDPAPPPLPVREYEEEEDDDIYNRLNLKTSNLKNGAQQETENIYGLASGTKVGPIKKQVLIPKADYSDSDSGESIHDDTYDTPEFDAYDDPVDLVKGNKSKELTNNYETSAKPLAKQKVHEESLYDEVS